jgi:hypothetical protein
VMGCFENGNEPSGSLESLSNCWLLKKKSATLSRLASKLVDLRVSVTCSTL